MQELVPPKSLGHIAQDILAFPGEDRYETARRAFNLAVEQRPRMIALPRNEQDVIAAVRIASALELTVAPQCTGHAATALPSLEGMMLLRTDRLREVDIDMRRRHARVGAGVRWHDLVPLASTHGLAALHGSSPDVGVVGYTLGGGLSWYARRLGLAVNRVTAVELVTADGQLRRIDHDHEPELFWAVRGGGASFGVVTALEFDLVPMPELFAGALFFPLEQADQVLHAWRSWVGSVPDELMSVGRILHFPPLPEVPEPLRGNAFALVEAVYIGCETDGAEIVAPLRRLNPVLDTFSEMRPVDLSELHMDPREPVPYDGDHQLLEHLPATAVDEIVRTVGADSGSPLLGFELRHLGGALARPESRHGAFGTLRGSFATFAAGLTPDAAATAAVRDRLEMVRAVLEPYDTGYAFPNFAMRATEATRLFPDAALSRLRQIRADVDPHGLFAAKHQI